MWNSQIGIPRANEILATKRNYCLLFHFYLFCSVLLSSHYIYANLLTHLLSNMLNKYNFNEISGMLQFYLITDSQNCY